MVTRAYGDPASITRMTPAHTAQRAVRSRCDPLESEPPALRDVEQPLRGRQLRVIRLGHGSRIWRDVVGDRLAARELTRRGPLASPAASRLSRGEGTGPEWPSRRPGAARFSLAKSDVVVSFMAVTVGTPEDHSQGCCAMLLNSGGRTRREVCKDPFDQVWRRWPYTADR